MFRELLAYTQAYAKCRGRMRTRRIYVVPADFRNCTLCALQACCQPEPNPSICALQDKTSRREQRAESIAGSSVAQIAYNLRMSSYMFCGWVDMPGRCCWFPQANHAIVKTWKQCAHESTVTEQCHQHPPPSPVAIRHRHPLFECVYCNGKLSESELRPLVIRAKRVGSIIQSDSNNNKRNNNAIVNTSANVNETKQKTQTRAATETESGAFAQGLLAS